MHIFLFFEGTFLYIYVGLFDDDNISLIRIIELEKNKKKKTCHIQRNYPSKNYLKKLNNVLLYIFPKKNIIFFVINHNLGI